MAVVSLYSDASFCVKNHLAAYSCRVVGARGHWRTTAQVPGHVEDNNTAELYATVHGLVGALRAGVLGEGDKVLVYTDSYFSIERIDGRKELKVTLEQQKLVTLAKRVITGFGLEVVLKHVQGHSGATGPLTGAIRDCDINARNELNRLRSLL